MSGQSQQHRLPSIRDLQASSGSTPHHHASNIILPPLTPPVIDSQQQQQQQQQPSSSSTMQQHHPPRPPQPPPQRTQRPAEVDLSEAIETCYMLCQQIEKLQDEWPNRDIQEQLDDLHKTSVDLLQLIREPTPIIGDVSKPEYAMIRRARNLQEGMGMTYRRRTKKTTVGQRCHSCNTTETPEWRRGPDGARTLCNACGLHYSKLLRRGSMTVQRMQSSIPPRVIDFPQGSSSSSPSESGTVTRILPQPMGIGIGYNTAQPPPIPSLLGPHSDSSTMEQMSMDYQ